MTLYLHSIYKVPRHNYLIGCLKQLYDVGEVVFTVSFWQMRRRRCSSEEICSLSFHNSQGANSSVLLLFLVLTLVPFPTFHALS